MANKQDLSDPLVKRNRVEEEEKGLIDEENEDLGMVFLSTFVAVCGSFEFGSCVSISFVCFVLINLCKLYFDDLQMGYSSPAQFGIMADLNLTISQVG